MNRRKYSSVLPFFHNFGHDPRGLTHCKGSVSNPYRIEHVRGKHKISHPYARGHGRGGKTQWFKFPKRLDSGFDLVSGVKVSTKDVPGRVKGKK